MAKTKKQLIAEGYEHFHHFGRKYFYVWLFMLAALLLSGLFIYEHLFDTGLQLNQNRAPRRCHGKGCGWVLLIYFGLLIFFSMPIWLKIPTFILVAINGLLAICQKLFWFLDDKPDLAICPKGVYFPTKIAFQELNWEDISRIEIVRMKKKNGVLSVPTLKFFGVAPTVRTLSSFAPLSAPLLLTIPPYWGFDELQILEAIKVYSSKTIVTNVEVPQEF